MIRDWKLFVPVLVAAVVLLGGAALDVTHHPASVDPPAEQACTYDPEKPTHASYNDFVSFTDPYVGKADAPVTVIEFFDPNCPHCRTLHPVMKEVVVDYRDQARFVYKPIALPGWDHSVPQVLAMYAAAEDGKFLMMMDEQFKRQKPRTGLSMQELREIAEQIGLDADAMEEQIRSGAGMDYMLAQRQLAGQMGVTGVPALLINGRFVHHSSKTAACIGQLIEEAAAAAGETG